MDGQLSPRKVIASSRYGSSLKNIYAEGVDRFGEIQARKYLERILTAVEELEFFYPYHPECRHLATKSRMYRNIILDAHLIIYRIGKERHRQGTHRSAGHRSCRLQPAKNSGYTENQDLNYEQQDE